MVTKALRGSEAIYYSTKEDMSDCQTILKKFIIGVYVNERDYENLTSEEALEIAREHAAGTGAFGPDPNVERRVLSGLKGFCGTELWGG